MTLKKTILLLLLLTSPAQAARVVVHPVAGGLGLNYGYKPLAVFCRSGQTVTYFQLKPRARFTLAPTTGKMISGVLSLNPSLGRISSRNQTSTNLPPGEVEITCKNGPQVKAGKDINLIIRQ